MSRQLVYMAVSATLGVTASSFFIYQHGRNVILPLFVMIFYFAASAFYAQLHVSDFSGTERQFTISFATQPKVDGNLLKGLVSSELGERLSLRYTIPVEKEQDWLSKTSLVGMSCPTDGTLEAPEPNRNENAFDYQNYLQSQNTHWILKADSISFAECVQGNHSPFSMIKKLRMKGTSYINDHFPHESAGFITALVFGDQSEIGEDDLTNYQRLGIVHLLAISGLHVSLLTGLFFYFGIRLGFTRERTMAFILMLLPVYMVLSGGSPSVMRSCLMAMLFFCLMLFKKRLSAEKAICLVYLALLFFQPGMLFNVGFQLSFAVTFSIIFSQRIFFQYPHRVLQLLMISTICQLAALPILLFHFYEASILGVFLNVLYVPIYSVVLLPFSMLALLVHLVSPFLGELLVTLLNVCFQVCNWTAEAVSHLPLASVAFGKPSFVIMFLLAGCLVFLFMNWERRLRKWNMWWGLLISLLLLQFHLEKLSPYGEVQVLDVGQGDSILVKLPYNAGNYLIDTGGQINFPIEPWKKKKKTFNTAKDNIIPLLKSKGIHRLDKLILTHADADHIGSVKELLTHFEVKEIVIGEWSMEAYRDKDFTDTAIAKGIPIHQAKRGDRWMAGDAAFYILNPHEQKENTNESSIVLYARIGGLSWLFTGDMGEEGEAEMIRHYPALKTDILKVGHHGSKTSSSEAFLKQLKPRAVLISVGKGNRYGHPHSQVISSLEEKGIPILRTDEHGALIYKYSKRGGTFHKVLP